MHRRLTLPLLILLAFALSAIQAPALQPAAVAAVPPPPDAGQAAAVLSAPAPIQLTDFDVRFHSVAVDGAGQIFVAVPYPGSKIRICRLIDARLSSARLDCFYDLPGLKHASVHLAVLSDGGLLVSWSNRREESGPFPLEATVLEGVATPAPRFGVAMPMVVGP